MKEEYVMIERNFWETFQLFSKIEAVALKWGKGGRPKRCDGLRTETPTC